MSDFAKDINVPINDCISRQAAIDMFNRLADDPWNANAYTTWSKAYGYAAEMIEEMPSAQSEKETPRRVLWSGWKGTRDTRYKCPNCKKPVKNDDVYCHRCGQKLMFPHISHTPYIEGQKQDLIVRWDDEE